MSEQAEPEVSTSSASASAAAKNIPVEPAAKMSGGVRVPAHSHDRPSEHKVKEGSVEAKRLEKQEQILVAQNAKALSDQLFEVDNQQQQQRTGIGKGVASTYQPPQHQNHHSHAPNITASRQIQQPGGGQAHNK